MIRLLMSTAAVIGAASMAQAGGIDRSVTPYAILWEKGNYAELSFGRVAADVSGTVGGVVQSGDMVGDYTQYSLSYKHALTDQIDLAITLDQPIGAEFDYAPGIVGSSPVPYPLNGSNGKITSDALTAMARYKIDDAWSVHGGVKIQRTKGNVSLSLPIGDGGATVPDAYTLKTSTETDLGYLVGVAYERPEIALRVALTYQSAIKHDFSGVESGLMFGGMEVPAAFTTEVPQSLNLDFQTGIAEDTLLFGSIRWREWSVFDINPEQYETNFEDKLLSYPKDVVTYNLGVGRKFNENWAGAISIGYESANNLPTGNLGPHDGMRSITLGATYTKDNMKITGGVTYVDIGDANTKPPVNGVFRDNSAVGFGLKVGYSF